MNTQTATEAKLSRLAAAFSANVSKTLARAKQQKQELLEEKIRAEARTQRALSERLAAAVLGFNHLLAFANEPSLQEVISTEERLQAPVPARITFYDAHWTFIDGEAYCHLDVAFTATGVEITTRDQCWCEQKNTFFTPYTQDVMVYARTVGDVRRGEDSTSRESCLQDIACARAVPLRALFAGADLVVPEEEVVFETLVRWGRKSTFDGAVELFLKRLKGRVR